MRISDWSSDLCSSDLKLPSRSMLHNVTVRQNWWGYETRESGTAQIDLKLRVPLTELVRRHHLTGYLGACKVEDSVFLERTGQQRHANETQWYIGRIARALQFMDATGLKPSSARRCYPTHAYERRDRQSVASGKSVTGRVDHGGGRYIKKKR